MQKILGILCLALMAAFAVATTEASGQAIKKVSIVQSTQSLNFVPLYIAQAKGYFKEEGLEPEIVLMGGGPKTMTALIGGAAQFSLSVLQDGINAHRAGRREVRAIASFMSSYVAPFVLSPEAIKKAGITPQSPLDDRIRALKGMRMGISTPGASTDFVLRYIVKTRGMNPDTDLEIVPIGGVDTMIVALQTKKIDGCSCFPPIDSVAESRGTGQVIIDAGKDLPELKGVTFSTLYSTESVIKNDPATVFAFIRALTRASNLIASDPEAAKQATRPFFKDVSDEIFNDSWSKLLPILPRSLEIERAGWDKELAMEKAVLPASTYKDVPYDNVVDMSFVQKAREQLKK